MPRTRGIFDWVYGLAPRPRPFHLEYLEAEDRGVSEAALKARAAREADSLRALETQRRIIADLAAMHCWLYREHRAYAPAPGFPDASLSPHELESY